MRAGDEVWHPIDRLTLRYKAQSKWSITSDDGIRREFAAVTGRSDGRWRIQRIVGQNNDGEIALTYDKRGRLAWVRDSADRLGVFISPDPLGIGGGFQPYSYVDNSTVDADPFGLAAGKYKIWQIHSPTYNDLVQKGRHFYSPSGLELSVRPTYTRGITFKNAIPNQAKDKLLPPAIQEAMDTSEAAEPRCVTFSAIKLQNTPRWSEARPRQLMVVRAN
jgi:RHS repeat-associated protein